MENYEQKYKGAMSFLKDLLHYMSDYCKEKLDGFFPELRESEDEKIRKEILEYFQQFENEGLHGVNISDWISWLEKQGEQKAIDKNKPKFKIEKGKWYVCIKELLDNYANIAFCEGDIYLSTQDGSLIPSNSNVPHDVVCSDMYFRDWTIQDAKDGDVLYSHDKNLLWIYKNTTTYYASMILDYAQYNCISINCDITIPLDTCLATEEQRKLLFQKVRESGYEWNAEKKELTKINKQFCYHNDGLYYAIDILEKTFGKVEGYQSDDGIIEHQTAIETVNALYHKKPAWSEEDEKMLEDTISCLSAYQNPDISKGLCYQEQIDWLKSLKPQPKHEWSEEDDKFIKELCNLLASISKNGYVGKYYAPDLVNKLQLFKTKTNTRQESSDEDVWSEEDKRAINDIIVAVSMYANGEIPYILPSQLLKDVERLKSIKPNHWKPTEEQMYILNWVANTLLSNDGIVEREAAKILNGLYNDLKSL